MSRKADKHTAMVIRNILKRYSVALEKHSYKCHIKKTALLLTLTFLLSTIIYIQDFSFKSVMPPRTWFSDAVQTQSTYVATSDNFNHDMQTSIPKTDQQIQQSAASSMSKCSTLCHHMAHPCNYNFILDELDKCRQQNPFLVLMVPVAPHELEARNAIRSTWGKENTVQGKTVMTLFLVGLPGGADTGKAQQQLQEESRQHRDLLQSNFVDSYFNLTLKTMVIMDWLVTHCPQASFGMKVDSDMFLNVENLMTLLLAPNTPRQNYITGMIMRERPVNRNKKSKYYVSEDLYPEPTYPIYLMGMGYVFSNDLPNKIVEASKKVKPFNIEDAYVGACLKRSGVQPSRPPIPSQFRTFMTNEKSHKLSRVITTIARSPKQLIEFWKQRSI
ncbi:beta-1,3-galactosyltransferase 2-like [Xyrauchen texanus]|uniref:beta-1,3-galactosyltransferase 2-like n=1 Tax=Xyrauchen texanus TaxID=154827 RepID=UPI0022419345|nr:beta-1,3-galactosyltransferase 2-like [Xyrauchen texanus]